VTAVPYQVAWKYRKGFGDDMVRHDDVQAPTATRAMNLVCQSLMREYHITRHDIVFLEVYRI
jgi:acetyl-CoA acetyltransferase